MDRLVRLLFIASGGLTCAEESKEGVREIQLHELSNSQNPIGHHEAAGKRITRALKAVTGEVDDIRVRNVLKYKFRRCARRHIGGEFDDGVCWCHIAYVLHFSFGIR